MAMNTKERTSALYRSIILMLSERLEIDYVGNGRAGKGIAKGGKNRKIMKKARAFSTSY